MLGEDRLRYYITYGNQIVRLYEDTRKKYLEFHIGLMTFASFAFLLFQDNINNEIARYFVIGGIVWLLITALINIVLEFTWYAKKTKGINQTNWHYRDNIKKEYEKTKIPFVKKIQDIKVSLKDKDLIKDDLTSYHNILIFQQRYFRLAKLTQHIVFLGIIGFIFGLIIGLIISF